MVIKVKNKFYVGIIMSSDGESQFGGDFNIRPKYMNGLERKTAQIKKNKKNPRKENDF